jgi:hypothetical protein
VADLYQPVSWVDGQQLTAVNSANRWENGLEALDVQQDWLTNQINALQGTSGSGRPFPSGTTANRPAPTIGQPYWDISLVPPRLIVGTGSAWVNVDGTAITDNGGVSSGTAPTNMQATVTSGGTIGTIHLTWDAVAGAASYKLYETESPTGVSGATALTTTFSDRTPSTARNYEYWVTATVGGVESASSNHVTATLPFGGGGATGSSDPTTFLNINGKGNGTGGWWNLGIGFSSGHTDISPTELQNGYVNSPYYAMNPTGTGVQFQVFLNGGTTSANTKYPRCELREYAVGSTTTKAAWSGSSGHHILRGASKLMHLGPNKPECTLAQMHDAADDTLQIEAFGTSASGPFDWKLRLFGTVVTTLLSAVPLGTEVAWDIDVNNGLLVVKMNGVQKYSGTPGFGSSQYFKCPLYPQQNVVDSGNPSTEYARVELRNLFVSHS